MEKAWIRLPARRAGMKSITAVSGILTGLQEGAKNPGIRFSAIMDFSIWKWRDFREYHKRKISVTGESARTMKRQDVNTPGILEL